MTLLARKTLPKMAVTKDNSPSQGLQVLPWLLCDKCTSKFSTSGLPKKDPTFPSQFSLKMGPKRKFVSKKMATLTVQNFCSSVLNSPLSGKREKIQVFYPSSSCPEATASIGLDEVGQFSLTFLV